MRKNSLSPVCTLTSPVPPKQKKRFTPRKCRKRESQTTGQTLKSGMHLDSRDDAERGRRLSGGQDTCLNKPLPPSDCGAVPTPTPMQGSRSRSQGNGASWQPLQLVSQNCLCLLPDKPLENHNCKTYFRSQLFWQVSGRGERGLIFPSQLPPHDKNKSYNIGILEPVTETHLKIDSVAKCANTEKQF